MIVINLSNFETSLEQVRKLVSNGLSKDEQEALFELNRFLLNKKNTISDSHLETLMQSSLVRIQTSDPDMSIEEFRGLLDKSISDEELSKEEQEITDAFLTILQYLLRNKNKQQALESHEKAVQNNWDLNIKLHVDSILE